MERVFFALAPVEVTSALLLLPIISNLSQLSRKIDKINIL